VEFKDRRVGKYVCKALHNNPIGGLKDTGLEDIPWKLKYLPRVTWDNVQLWLVIVKKKKKKKKKKKRMIFL